MTHDDANQQTVHRGEADRETSLWECLHDAEVTKVFRDRARPSVGFEFDIVHLREFAGLADDVRWCLVLGDPTAMTARTWHAWAATGSSDRVSRDEPRAKGCHVSIGWGDFERAVDTDGVDIQQAFLHHRENAITFSGYGFQYPAMAYFEFEVVSGSLRCQRSDIGEIPFDELLQLAERYWQECERRRPTPRDTDHAG